jgi:DNA-directed RNA polymerase subunit beta'
MMSTNNIFSPANGGPIISPVAGHRDGPEGLGAGHRGLLHAQLGRPATIDLLDNMKAIGFKPQHAGGVCPSASTTCAFPKPSTRSSAPQKAVDRIEAFSQGALTELERYNQLIDAWTHARELVTEEMMKELRSRHR